MIRAAPSSALHRLLDECLDRPPEYAEALSSHLPMALAALDGLGADETRLRRFMAGYVGKFTARAPAPTMPAPAVVDWRPLRGRFEAFDVLRATFAAALRRDGSDAVLRDALPSLIDGVGAAAFHGPIRLAHAVESQHDGEIVAALAYWAARWMPLRLPDEAPPEFDDVAAWLDAIDRAVIDDRSQPRSTAPLIALRMQDAARTSAYQRLAGGLRGREETSLLHEASRAAAARYAATRNFTVLHMVTGTRAAGVLAPWLAAGDAVLAPLWHAVAAASIASGVAVIPVGRPNVAAAAWSDVVAAAIASDDEHVIKLVHACAVQNATVADDTWLRAAAVAVAGATG